MKAHAGGGQLVVLVLGEALKHFGTITPQNQAQVARWVQRRVNELRGDRPPLEAVDVKQRAAGD